jgi:hypothetical protein
MDRQILELAAKELKLAETVVADRKEKISSSWEKLLQIIALGACDGTYVAPPYRLPPNEAIFAMGSNIMHAAAGKVDCVIVGRGARAVFRDEQTAYHLFLHAPDAFRIQRIMKYYGAKTKQEAHAMIAASDRSRAAFMARIMGTDWFRPDHYDLCIDTSRALMESIVGTIIQYLTGLRNRQFIQ